MPGPGTTSDPNHTQGILRSRFFDLGSKIWEMAVWEQAAGQQALAGGFASSKSRGPAWGADKTTRSCLSFARRKAAKGFSKTILQ